MDFEGKSTEFEVQSYFGEDFMPLITFESWRVAVYNYSDIKSLPQCIQRLDKHIETDEIFILLKGECILVMGGNGDKPSKLWGVRMEPYKVYDIKKNTWHAHLLTPDTMLAIVENSHMTRENNAGYPVDEDMRAQMLELGREIF